MNKYALLNLALANELHSSVKIFSGQTSLKLPLQCEVKAMIVRPILFTIVPIIRGSLNLLVENVVKKVAIVIPGVA